MVHFSRLAFGLGALLFSQSAVATIYTNYGDVPKLSWDFVVVGGGIGGAVVASRLSENPYYNVLLLEAGGSDEGIQSLQIPFDFGTLTPNTPFDWNYTTTAQPGLNGRTITMARGFVLGGSSSVNFMVYSRGSSDDYDRYAAISGDIGWSWLGLQPYIFKHESLVPAADGHSYAGEFNPFAHGYMGPLQVSIANYPLTIDPMVVQTTKDLPEFPFALDMNDGKPIGIGWAPMTVGGGERSSSSRAYLNDNVQKRQNLAVLVNARVTKILQTGTSQGVPVFQSVQFSQDHGASFITVNATKEIVLSAGAVNTPALLMRSGIGAKADLSALGINTIINNPSVGANLSDHPLVIQSWQVKDGADTWETHLRNATVSAADLQQWQTTKTGFLTDNIGNMIGWLRLPKNSSIFETDADPSAGPNSAHHEFIIANGNPNGPPPSGNFMSISTALVSPSSRGNIKINSTDPFAAPLINPNFLATNFDIFTMRESLRAAFRFLAGPAWTNYVIGPFGALANVTLSDDSSVDTYVRNNALSVLHPFSTTSMSPVGASWGVVDPDLKLKGAIGVRIVDAGVVPIVPSAHPQACVYIVAERAADLIKFSWLS